jgi:hypothetical protein
MVRSRHGRAGRRRARAARGCSRACRDALGPVRKANVESAGPGADSDVHPPARGDRPAVRGTGLAHWARDSDRRRARNVGHGSRLRARRSTCLRCVHLNLRRRSTQAQGGLASCCNFAAARLCARYRKNFPRRFCYVRSTNSPVHVPSVSQSTRSVPRCHVRIVQSAIKRAPTTCLPTPHGFPPPAVVLIGSFTGTTSSTDWPPPLSPQVSVRRYSVVIHNRFASTMTHLLPHALSSGNTCRSRPRTQIELRRTIH